MVDGRSAQAALAIFHRLIVQRLIARQQAADARAARGKALGHGVDDDDIFLIALQLQQAHERLAAVDEFAVHLVANEEESVLLGDIGHELHLLSGENGSGRVAGVREHDGTGVLVDAGLDALTNCKFVALLRLCGQRMDGRAGQIYEGGVVRIKRLRNDDLVALVENAAQHDLQRFAAAGGDEYILFAQLCADLGIIAADSVDQLRHAGGRRIGQNLLAEFAYRFKIRGRRFNIGLTDVQVVNLLAGLLRLNGVRRKLAHRGQAAAFDFAGKFHSDPPFYIFLFCVVFP